MYVMNEGFERLWEMGCLCRIPSGQMGLKYGMVIEVQTSEYQGTGEEPHFHLYPASHRDRKGKANNYDLITRVRVTEQPPTRPDDIQAIYGNPPVPRVYQQAIYRWSRAANKRGINNWTRILELWDGINSRL